MLNLSLPLELVATLQTSFPFKWQSHHIKYLGVAIPMHPSHLFKSNFSPLLQSLDSDLTKWSKNTLSWFGKMAAIKMDILTRVLYFFQTIPILLPNWFFHKLTSLMIK